MKTTDAFAHAIFDNALDAMVIADDDGRWVAVNDAAVDLFGLPREALLGRRAQDFTPPGESAAAFVASAGQVGELVVRRPDGSLRHTEVRGRVGIVPGRYLSVLRDVTPRKEAESRIAQSEQRYRLLVEASTDVTIVTGARDPHTIAYASPSARNALGYAPRELEGRRLEELVPVRDRPLLERMMSAALTEGRLARARFHLVRADGTLASVEASCANLRHEPTIGGLVCNLRDVTERDEVLATLEAAQALAHVGSWVWSPPTPDGTITSTKENLRIFGIPETGGTRIEEYLERMHPEDRERILQRLSSLSNLDGAVEDELRLVHPDGSTRWVYSRGKLERDRDGRIVRFLGTTLDITERRRAESELRERDQQLRQAQRLESLGQLAGGVAHDFNNILTVILGYTSSLAEELAEDDPHRADVVEIHEAGERGMDVTRQLLAFSRTQIFEPRVFDLGASLLETEKMLRRLGGGVELELRCAPGKAFVKADPGQIHQVVLNLVVNARDATSGEGRVVVETAHVALEEDDAARLGLRPGGYALVSVTDDGLGMSPSTVSRIFEPFFTTKERGTGLGLSTVFGIVSQSGGKVVVDSREGHGTTFRVYLPATDERPANGSSQRPVSPPPGRGERILVVEDDPHVRQLAAAVLQRAGYVVRDVESGAAALATGGADTIDLLLADIIPRARGLELATRLRATHPELPVVFTSGYADPSTLEKRAAVPGSTFLPKPLTADTLLRAVADALSARGPRSGSAT